MTTGLRIGIDVGGTNTDAVLMRGRTVLAQLKSATTRDVTSGIETALRGLSAAVEDAGAPVAAVMIGTTHFTNAFVDARELTPCGVIRLCLPATAAVPPFEDWPASLVEAIGGHVALCSGGREFDGRPISAVDPAELRRVAAEFRARGIDSVAIVATFSPLTADDENAAAAVVAEILPKAHISLSHEIGRIGLLERENATIINASLRNLAERIATAFTDATARVGIDAPVFVSQNDGTLMSVDTCRRYPVTTFASGPTNSMRGAAFLSGLDDCLVVDIGGTTTDVGIVVNGFPRAAGGTVELAGVRTNFRMPDVYSIGIGGGSLVTGRASAVSVGPASVGHRLTTQARVFGGDVLTASDIAVAAGLAKIGDDALLGELDGDLVSAAIAAIESAVAAAVDRMRTSTDPLPWVLVGGGSVLLGGYQPEHDLVVRPEHFEVANAVGAAIAQVGAELDTVVTMPADTRAQVLDELTAQVSARAVAAGAAPETVRVVEIDELPITYLPGARVRVRVKAVGELAELADGPASQEAVMRRA